MWIREGCGPYRQSRPADESVRKSLMVLHAKLETARKPIRRARRPLPRDLPAQTTPATCPYEKLCIIFRRSNLSDMWLGLRRPSKRCESTDEPKQSWKIAGTKACDGTQHHREDTRRPSERAHPRPLGVVRTTTRDVEPEIQCIDGDGDEIILQTTSLRSHSNVGSRTSATREHGPRERHEDPAPDSSWRGGGAPLVRHGRMVLRSNTDSFGSNGSSVNSRRWRFTWGGLHQNNWRGGNV